jgi:hypothetical protein
VVGETGGEAVLCTRDKTFALRNVETSNTVLLIPPAMPVRTPYIHATVPHSVARVGDRVWAAETSEGGARVGMAVRTQREDHGDTEEGTAAAPMEVADEEETMEVEAMEGASQGAAATQTSRLPGLMTQMHQLEQRSKDAPTIVATSRVSGQMELVAVSCPTSQRCVNWDVPVGGLSAVLSPAPRNGVGVPIGRPCADLRGSPGRCDLGGCNLHLVCGALLPTDVAAWTTHLHITTARRAHLTGGAAHPQAGDAAERAFVRAGGGAGARRGAAGGRGGGGGRATWLYAGRARRACAGELTEPSDLTETFG